ncbi:Hypothetical protein A7982_01725 [Minicystis rosea]|nr:Hypothetical protein A7982_01725 [Minicystis rosea]
MTIRLSRLGLSAALAGAFAACSYPTFTYGTGGNGAGGDGTASSSASSSSSSESSSSVSSSSSSTGGPVKCRLKHDAEDCKAGERCTIVDPSTGNTQCVPLAASTYKPFAACTTDDACPAGTWCDSRTATCAPFCESFQDCGSGDCVAAKNYDSASMTTHTVPGATVCTANCDPASATSCGPGAACNYDNNAGSFDCFYSLNKAAGSDCEFGDCAPTLVCGSQCLKWCHPVEDFSSECPNAGYCNQFTNLTPTYNGSKYGFCTP